ncbi:MAG: hypothetical protein HN742_40290, partial [Lentisphaerae bacterium]|nr:hypothetical protein [Lentisphaerota bacterium]
MGPADTRNLKPGDIRNPDGVLTDLDTGAPERSVRETVERQDRAETLEEIRDLVESSLYVKRG